MEVQQQHNKSEPALWTSSGETNRFDAFAGFGTGFPIRDAWREERRRLGKVDAELGFERLKDMSF